MTMEQQVIGEVTPRSRDVVISYGERLASIVVVAILEHAVCKHMGLMRI